MVQSIISEDLVSLQGIEKGQPEVGLVSAKGEAD
jgi:hypothetical protein